jgi:hypothetical protein
VENAERVRRAIAAADRHRRRRAASAQTWRVAPIVAAAVFAIALVGRWAGWPPAVPVGLLAAALLTFTLHLVLSRRHRAISDAVAAAIDTHAGLRGELRSANWFAGRDARNEWADLHIDRAAGRLDDVDWSELYPRVRAGRARIATSLLIVATLVLAVAFPRRAATSVPSPTDVDGVRLKPGAPLSPELLKQLEDLLAAAETGTLELEGEIGKSIEMRELLERLKQIKDRNDLERLARGMSDDETRSTAEELRALAERLRHAAEMSESSREFQKAMDELARNLSEAAGDEQPEAESARLAASADGDQSKAGAQSSEFDEASIQAVKEAQSAGGAGDVTMSNQNAPGSSATPGFGVGGSGNTAGEAPMPEIDQALRQELIEANRDRAGANVDAEIRRQTEQGQATVAFTHGAAGKSDKSRAAAPPPVPETRRADVQRYFIRKP